MARGAATAYETCARDDDAGAAAQRGGGERAAKRRRGEGQSEGAAAIRKFEGKKITF